MRQQGYSQPVIKIDFFNRILYLAALDVSTESMAMKNNTDLTKVTMRKRTRDKRLDTTATGRSERQGDASPFLENDKLERILFETSPVSNTKTFFQKDRIPAASTTSDGVVNNSPKSCYPVYYVSPYGPTQSSNIFFINYLIHQALSLTALALGYCLFLTIGAQFLTSLFSSVVILSLTGILAGLCAFPVAALGSTLLTRYFQSTESQRSVFLMLATVCQIVFNVLLLAGLSSTYFFALCALYIVVPLLILAIRSVLPYCQCPTLPQPNTSYDMFTPITDTSGNQKSVHYFSIFGKQNPLSADESSQPGSNDRSSGIYYFDNLSGVMS